MTEKEREYIEQRLMTERERVIKMLDLFQERTKITAQEDDGELSSYPFHLADEGTDTMEQEKEFLLASKEGRLLILINDALRTLYRDPDRYGTCESCGEQIPHARLEILPWTRMCVSCQSEQENQRLAA
jgi:DnaK suppressor protein